MENVTRSRKDVETTYENLTAPTPGLKGKTLVKRVCCLMLEIHNMILSNKYEVYLNIPLNALPSKVRSSIFSPLTRWTWARLGRRVRSTEPRSPKSGSSTPPGSSQGWTTVTPAGWPMAAFGMQSPGHEETAVPPSQGCAALGSHLPTTSTESTVTKQTMNEQGPWRRHWLLMSIKEIFLLYITTVSSLWGTGLFYICGYDSDKMEEQ